MIKVEERLATLLAELNVLCPLEEQCSLVRQPRKQRTETGYLPRGYYLVCQSAEQNEHAGMEGHDQLGGEHFIGTNAPEAARHLRNLIKARHEASLISSTWWDRYRGSLPEQRQP